MMKKLINSDRMTWFRRRFLIKIRTSICFNYSKYCCRVICWEGLFICWKNLKEVEENMNSMYLLDYRYHNMKYDCNEVWFSTKQNRLEFLDQCLKNLRDEQGKKSM